MLELLFLKSSLIMKDLDEPYSPLTEKKFLFWVIEF
jgi:hypothetical protein